MKVRNEADRARTLLNRAGAERVRAGELAQKPSVATYGASDRSEALIRKAGAAGATMDQVVAATQRADQKLARRGITPATIAAAIRRSWNQALGK